MKLKSIKQSNAKGYLILGFLTDEGYESFLLSERQYISLGSPSVGDEPDEEALRRISDYGAYNKAKKKALGILSYGDNSRRSLINKLVRSGAERQLAERIADEMQALGYIDEERQIARLIECELRTKIMGPSKLTAKLAARGYMPEKIRAVIRRMTLDGEISFDELKRSLIESLPEDASREEVKKILYKHGF